MPMILVYRKHKNSGDRDWHFHTQCPRWPEKDYDQSRYLEPAEIPWLCRDCLRLESEMQSRQ